MACLPANFCEVFIFMPPNRFSIGRRSARLVNRRGGNLSEWKTHFEGRWTRNDNKDREREGKREREGTESRWKIKAEENGRYGFMASFVYFFQPLPAPKSSNTLHSPWTRNDFP